MRRFRSPTGRECRARAIGPADPRYAGRHSRHPVRLRAAELQRQPHLSDARRASGGDSRSVDRRALIGLPACSADRRSALKSHRKPGRTIPASVPRRCDAHPGRADCDEGVAGALGRGDAVVTDRPQRSALAGIPCRNRLGGHAIRCLQRFRGARRVRRFAHRTPGRTALDACDQLHRCGSRSDLPRLDRRTALTAVVDARCRPVLGLDPLAPLHAARREHAPRPARSALPRPRRFRTGAARCESGACRLGHAVSPNPVRSRAASQAPGTASLSHLASEPERPQDG